MADAVDAIQALLEPHLLADARVAGVADALERFANPAAVAPLTHDGVEADGRHRGALERRLRGAA